MEIQDHEQQTTQVAAVDPPQTPPVLAPIPVEIQERIDVVAAAKQKLENIRTLITKTKADRHVAELERVEAFTALSESEAASALDGIVISAPQRKAALKGQENLMIADALLTGLVRREQMAVLELGIASDQLTAAFEDWTRSEIQKARGEFIDLMHVFITASAPIVARGLMLGDSAIGLVSRGTVIPDIGDPKRPDGWDVIRHGRHSELMQPAMNAVGVVNNAVDMAVRGARNIIAPPPAVPIGPAKLPPGNAFDFKTRPQAQQ